MIVYGKRRWHEPTAALADAARTGDVLAAARLACGLADRAQAQAGEDTPDPLTDAAMAALCAIVAGRAPDLSRLRAEGEVAVGQWEGVSFYPVLSETYALIDPSGGPWRVVGIRGTGTWLGAVVAQTLGAPPPVTVRPTGHPWARRVRASDALGARLLDGHRGRIAVVDEGPGMSGSSFDAVVDWLVGLGVAESHITLVPSHTNPPGSAASPECLARWERLDRRPARSALVAPMIHAGVEALVGPVDTFADIGEPRPLSAATYRATAGRRAYAARFIGQEFAPKRAICGRLAAAGFGPEPLGVTHGFLVEPWLDDAPRHTPSLARLGDYLALRAALPARPGASLTGLLAMAAHNGAAVPGAAAWTARQPRDLPVRPCAIDGRMHAANWVLADGRVTKLDALNGHDAHDLVGGQDIVWDIAGAAVELGLDPAGIAALITRTGGNPALQPIMSGCYLAFQLGRETVRGGDPGHYARELAAFASSSGGGGGA